MLGPHRKTSPDFYPQISQMDADFLKTETIREPAPSADANDFPPHLSSLRYLL
jgi:hypothetical protein